MPDPTLYDRLKADGLEPPESVKLVDTRGLTDGEREFGLALERALVEHADVWQALADNDKRAQIIAANEWSDDPPPDPRPPVYLSTTSLGEVDDPNPISAPIVTFGQGAA